MRDARPLGDSMPALPNARIGRVAVGSTNPVKIAAARAVFGSAMPAADVEGVAIASGVPEQPRGDDETISGATRRALGAMAALDADVGVGIEGGVVELADGTMRSCAWAVVTSRDGRSGVGGSLAMPLPPVVAREIRNGLELGAAMDKITGAHDTKRGTGAVGILTAGLVDRQRAYEIILTYALAPFLTPDLWSARE